MATVVEQVLVVSNKKYEPSRRLKIDYVVIPSEESPDGKAKEVIVTSAQLPHHKCRVVGIEEIPTRDRTPKQEDISY